MKAKRHYFYLHEQVRKHDQWHVRMHDGVYKLSVPCVSCHASGINEEGKKEIVEGIEVQTWLTGKVSDVVSETQMTEAVADIPIFNRIRELNKQEMMAVYQNLEQNN
jgi:hypothetical protein